MVARSLYDKGYQEYVDAAKVIRKEIPDTECWLLGKIAEAYPNHVQKAVVEKENHEGTIRNLRF